MTVLARFFALKPAQRLLLVQALAALLLAALEVRFVPFRRIGRRLGVMQPPLPAAGPAAENDPAAARARQIAWALSAAARRLPFDPTCLVRALAGRALCRRSGLAATVHFGAQSGQSGMAETHAWLDAAGVELVGYPLPPGMVEVGCFPGRTA